MPLVACLSQIFNCRQCRNKKPSKPADHYENRIYHSRTGEGDNWYNPKRERGIRTFETSLRFTLDLGVVPYLKLHTHLPVIVGPSHAPGDRRLVPQISNAAAAVGADGIIVETTLDPEAAQCDGPQQLFTSDFKEYADKLFQFAELAGKSKQ